MPVQARRFIRKMRGGAQAHLLQASDGHCYVVKFINNPQHRRVLVNEWLSSVFLDYLGIAAPPAAMVEVTSDFLQENPDIHLQLGRERQAVVPGWHFGSRFPGDPARTVVYDFLPDAILPRVHNPADFRGVFVFDKWAGNADARQAIFYRTHIADVSGEAPPGLGFVAQMVDNGYVFEGPHWRFGDSPIQGLYFRPLVYNGVRGWDAFEPWLERIRHFPEEVVDRAMREIPPPWLDGDEDALERLLEALLRRRKRVADLIEQSRSARTNPFPAWGV